MDCSPPGSSAHGIFQARVLEWGAIDFSESGLMTPICLFLFLFLLLWEVDHRGSCYDLCQRLFCLCFPLRVLEFLVLHFGKGNATPLQYSCLENSMGGGAWWAAVRGVMKSQTRLSDFTFTFTHWRRKWQPTPVSLPGESQGQGSLVGCRLWGRTESDTTEAT